MAFYTNRLRGFAGASSLRQFATASSSQGKVARFTLESSDLGKSASFFNDACGLRIAPQAAAQQIVAGDGIGLSCDLVLSQGGSKRGTANAGAAGALDTLDCGEDEDEPLIRPFMTIGVSNLKTSARHAKRQFGAVVRDPYPLVESGTGVTTQAVFADPDGRRLRALHLFRRTPLVSLTLGVRDVGAAAESYARVFDLRRVVDPEEAREAHPRPGKPSAVMAFGPVHASTAIVLEQAAAPRAPLPDDPDAPAPPVVELAVTDLPTTYHHVIGAGWAASPFSEGADRGFTCADPDGNVFYCSALPAAA